MLTNDEKQKLYAQAWDLIDEAGTVLDSMSAEEDINDLRSLITVAKRKVEEKAKIHFHDDPN